jgi:diacylglycerol kinase
MGVCTELGNLMIVTELMHGSVESVVKKRKDFTSYQAINMAKDAALGTLNHKLR